MAVATRTTSRGEQARMRLRMQPGLLVVPAVLLVAACFIYPVILILTRSFTVGDGGLSQYSAAFDNRLYVTVLLRTVVIAGLVTVISLALAYPYAYLAATTGPRARILLLALIASPLFISLLVRSYGWLVLLDKNGLVGWVLRETGVTDDPPLLVHNRIGVLVGLVQYTLPLIVLPIYASMRQYDHRLTQAAQTLGAGKLVVLARVYFPQTLPGVVAGCAIVFVSTLGYYIAPAILGGASDTMLGELIAQQVTTTLNWGLASALATILLAVALVGFAVFYRFSEGRSAKGSAHG
jgi:putative spermidine/putrescine transport system permease protein